MKNETDIEKEAERVVLNDPETLKKAFLPENAFGDFLTALTTELSMEGDEYEEDTNII